MGQIKCLVKLIHLFLVCGFPAVRTCEMVNTGTCSDNTQQQAGAWEPGRLGRCLHSLQPVQDIYHRSASPHHTATYAPIDIRDITHGTVSLYYISLRVLDSRLLMKSIGKLQNFQYQSTRWFQKSCVMNGSKSNPKPRPHHASRVHAGDYTDDTRLILHPSKSLPNDNILEVATGPSSASRSAI